MSYDTKSSCATIVPPTQSKFNATRKETLIPLKINTMACHDTGSMTETSPMTVVSCREEHTWIQRLKRKLKLQAPAKNADQRDTHAPEKQHPHNNQSNRVVRHSYSDPRLSPGSTAVGGDDEEQQGYFSAELTKITKRTPRAWVAAVLMIVFGALIAVTFVLIGLGKALGDSSNVASIQSNSTTTSSSLNLPTVVALLHNVINPTATHLDPDNF